MQYVASKMNSASLLIANYLSWIAIETTCTYMHIKAVQICYPTRTTSKSTYILIGF